MKYSLSVSSSRRKSRKVTGVARELWALHRHQKLPVRYAQAPSWPLHQCKPNCARVQAHFTAPSSERRKLMSAPLSGELRTKYQARPPQNWSRCTNKLCMHTPPTPPPPAPRFPISPLPTFKCLPVGFAQVRSVPVRKDDEVQVARGTYKVSASSPWGSSWIGTQAQRRRNCMQPAMCCVPAQCVT